MSKRIAVPVPVHIDFIGLQKHKKATDATLRKMTITVRGNIGDGTAYLQEIQELVGEKVDLLLESKQMDLDESSETETPKISKQRKKQNG